MKVALRAKLVVTAAVAGGSITVALALWSLANQRGLGYREIVLGLVLGGLVVASWVWPLVIHQGTQSEAIQLDEGFFVVMVLVLSPGAMIVAFALAIVLAQAVRRRPLVKSLFNFGQILSSVGVGWAASAVIAGPTGPLTPARLCGAIAGAVAFFVLNNVSLAAILAATGIAWRRSVLNGIEIRLLLLGAGVVIGLTTALLLTAYRWSLPLAVLPFLILRQLLAGHFQARRDRARLVGLFEATLDANRAMGDGAVTATILESARTLLRCPDAALSETAPGAGQMGAGLQLDGQELWLVVSGRSRQEPFDAADSVLLEALAAVGAAAITNATLYHEGRYQRRWLSAVTSSLGEGVCAIDAVGRILFLNPAAAHMLGRDAVLPGAARANAGGSDGPPAPPFLLIPGLRAIEQGETIRNDDTTFRRADGSSLPVAFTASPIVDDGATAGAVIAFRDITERKAFEEQLARHAFHDALTGLPNRRLFFDHLDHALGRSARSKEIHAVLFADLDRFKVINDSLGHHAGDQLLKSISDRIQKAIRPGDLLARFGGDEFTLLIEGVAGVDEAMALAERIRACLVEPITLPDGHDVVATLSIGIALTAEGKSRDDILRDADVAMYRAKAKGRAGHIEVFDMASMGSRSAERLELEAALHRAVQGQELDVYYQPLFAIDSRDIVGAEALVRWRHPERGLLSPAEFIGLAEETGLILPLGRFVLESACRQTKTWRDHLGVPLSISVNLSARQFQQPDLLDDIKSVLAASAVDPRQICLEITESVAVEDPTRTGTVLRRLKELGLRVAIDDFGTGYSSLGYLKQFPVDVVKFDRSFVDGLDTNPVDSAIVAAVVNLANAIGMTTVAEGVETLLQLEHLQSLGCPVVQGYYLSRPLTVTDFEAMLGETFDDSSEGAGAGAEPAVSAVR